MKMRLPNWAPAQALTLSQNLPDCTPKEQAALMAIWCICGTEAGTFGPSLLAHMIGVKRGTAKKLLSQLYAKNYVTTDSRGFKSGVKKAATRQLTKRVNWPERLPKGNRNSKSESVTDEYPKNKIGYQPVAPNGYQPVPLNAYRRDDVDPSSLQTDGAPTAEQPGDDEKVYRITDLLAGKHDAEIAEYEAKRKAARE